MRVAFGQQERYVPARRAESQALTRRKAMTDNFINSFRSGDEMVDEFDDEAPDWVRDIAAEDETESEDDSFDQLRRKSARAGAASEGTVMEDEGDSNGAGLSLSHLSPPQRLILAVLLLLDVVVIILGILAVSGRISL